MRLSDAMVEGGQYASIEMHNGRYFQFTSSFSFASTKIGADPLFAAFLGKYKGGGLVEVVRALKSHDRPIDAACWVILDGLSKAFRILGETCSDAIHTSAKRAGAPAPEPKQSLWMYICVLNDDHRYDRARIVDIIRGAGE